MKLTKKTVAIALAAFMVIAIASFAPPITAQTASAELMQAKPKWKHLVLSEHPYQIVYAKVRNNGTEPVLGMVEFVIHCPGGIVLFLTEPMWLPVHPKPIVFTVSWGPELLGYYYGWATLYYRAEGADWIMDGRESFEFKVVP